MTRAADPARRAAWQVLRAVAERDAYANLALPGIFDAARLDARDRALATELAYGTLRALGTLDHLLGLSASRPLDALDPPLRDALRLGAYQLWRTRIPRHAAVGATVDLAREVAGQGAAGFANAVLRRTAARLSDPALDEGDRLGAPPAAVDPVGHLAVTLAHPRWVVEAFRDALGGDMAETAAALAADDDRPVTHLAAHPGRITRDQLLAQAREAGLTAEPGPWSAVAVRLSGGDPGRLAAVRDSRAAVQDEGSQLVATALAAAPLLGADGGRWVDLCAGPGGKASLLAGLAAGGGARLVAVELRRHRAVLVTRALRGTTNAVTVQADGRRPPVPPGTADRVLLDAPCTGLGALRRRPEARWRRQPEDVGRLQPLQRGLLHAALDATRQGGVVAYVTCSPHLGETRDVVAAVLAGRSDATLLDARPLLAGIPDLGPGPAVQLWPHRHGTDAMSLHLLRRG